MRVDEARRQCAERDGAAFYQARHTKERCPELTGERGRARLVVLACERGGRSEEAQSFLRHLARERARSEPREIRIAARGAWLRRWRLLLAKVGLAKVGFVHVGHTTKTLTLAKVGLAKLGRQKGWPKSVWPKSVSTSGPPPLRDPPQRTPHHRTKKKNTMGKCGPDQD